MLPEQVSPPNLSVLNRYPKVLPGPKYLHHLVRQSSTRDELAIDFLEDGSKRRKITYTDLHAASDALAEKIRTHLKRLENPSAVIPVFLPQSPALYMALLGILKSGRAFCPIGLDSPTERVEFILNDISADLLITNEELKHKFPASSSVQPLLFDQNEPPNSQSPDISTHQPQQTNLAYVLYTSGSTGLPKAVSVSHRAVTQSLLAHDRHIPRFSRFLQFAAPTFDVSIFEIFFPLYRGCTLVGCTRASMLNDLPATITSMGVDAAELTPTVVSNLLRGRKSVPGLKLLLTIGEMLTRDVIDEFGSTETRPGILWGMYGPTEAAIHCTLQPSFPCASTLGNIGFPLETVTALVAAPVSQCRSARNVKILPSGEVGELVVGGPQVADEYLNRPDLTSESFIHDQEFGYLYRTGDKARLCSDGTLECLGRLVSGQVKLRGQRVELGEIEQTIIKIDDCYNAVAMVIQDTLVAFCATESSITSITTVQEMCRKWLPTYMVPGDVIILESMPQLSSGKIDKKALELQYMSEQQSGSLGSQYGNASDLPLESTFRTVLGREITDNENFSDVGLDSLRSIRIASSLREQGFDIGSIDILSTTNLGELKSLCEGRRTRRRDSIAPTKTETSLASNIMELEFSHDDIASVIPCTPLQEAMLAETSTRPSAYCNWIEVEISEQCESSRVCELIELLVQQNEILRTGFCMANKITTSFVQVVWKRMQPNTLNEVTSFSRAYSLGSTQSLLRPFNVQIITATGQPRLLFQIHHALYDGWSFDLLLRDLDGLMRGHSIARRPQFSEVVKYYSELYNSGELNKSKEYWRRVLDGYQPTALPNFNGRKIPYTGLRSLRGKSTVNLNALLTRAKEYLIHPQVFYQAAVAYMLSQYLGVSDVAIGTVTSGRTIPVTRVEEVFGPCIATLPCRVDQSNCCTVEDLLQKIHQANREMLEHCILPLRDITKLCQLRPRERLLDILFVWQESHVSADNQKLALKAVDSADDLEFKITFEFEPCDGNVVYRITYDPSVIPDKQIQLISRQIDHTVQYFIASGDKEPKELKRSFSPALLSIANPTPEKKIIHHGPVHSVEQWALKTPDKDAIIVGTIVNGDMSIKEKLSYGSLNARSNQLAHALVKLGVGNDQLVCVMLEKSTDLYVSILAVLKTGCGYLPIVPDTPTERVNHILEDARVKICISDSKSSEATQRDELMILNVDQMDLSNYPHHNLAIPYKGNHLAYAVFTSGSTGKPKGVLVTQDNLMNNLDYLASVYPYDENSKLLQSCSQAFDVSVFEIFFSWYVGICLCTAAKDDLFYDFEAAIQSLGVTHLSLTPTVAGLVDPDRVSKVKFLVTAGEAVTEGVKRKWAGKGLYQGYGPSETTNICTVKPRVTDDDLINNIGSVFSNTSVVILEPGSDNAVPRGAIGELCFGGAQVFRGYLNRPDLNAQKLIEHPKYGRIYRSGDMGRLLPDDSILSTGRLDDQVKIRGQRVELGEVTSLVLDHPFVHDCATLLIDDGHARQKLVVFWVPERNKLAEYCPLDPEQYQSRILEIFESLSLQLPAYMVPMHVVPISSIPMTPQAKIDKRLLHNTFGSLTNEHLELTSSSSEKEQEDKALSQTEQRIAQALSQTLGLPLADVTRSSSFFNLGLDSVSAIQFAKCLRDAGVGHAPVSLILKNPTLRRLSSMLSDQSKLKLNVPDSSALTSVFDPIQVSQIRSEFPDNRAEIERILPCTPLQEAMLSSGSPNDASYYNLTAFTVKGDLGRMKKCWESVINRHEILRTTFVPTDNSQYAFAQVVLKHGALIWDELDHNANLTAYSRKLLPDLLRLRKPPIRLAVQNYSGSVRLVFCCHHALYDGIAIDILLNEVQKLYFGEELPAPVPYDVYLRHLINQDFEGAHRFWSKALENFEPTYFPNLSSNKPRSPKSACSTHRLMGMPLSAVSKYCREQSISLLSLVQSAWSKVLYFVLAETDLCFGNVISGRTLPEDGIDRLVAPCFNTLPVRLDFDFRKSNVELCKKLHSFNVNVLPFQLTPLRWIQTKTRKEQGRLFDTLVILQQPSAPLNDTIWNLDLDDGHMDLPIVCEVSQNSGSDTLVLSLHYQSDLCQAQNAEALSEIFEFVLQSLVRFPNSAANDTIGFPNRLLGQANMDFRPFDPPQGELLHYAFEHNARKNPDATALEFRHSKGTTTTFTFESLNAKANQVAHALIQLGTQPEDVIPVYMSKTPEFYISILGVLKSGAAFSPIHPDLPDARKQFMVLELKPKAVLSLRDTIDWLDNVVVLNVKKTESYPTSDPVVNGLRSTGMAYCLYTSGSTGLPKAVSMEHRSPIQTVESSRSLVPWDRDSRLLQYAAITFDMCYYDCFLAWILGFTLCAADQDMMLNNLSDSVNALKVDLLDLTPSVAISLKRSDVPNVKWLYCIGEAMTSEVVAEWAGACGNSYGPTEAAFCTTIFPTAPEVKTSIIGKPFPTTSFAVFSPHGERPMPLFGVGELYIGGAQLARGYYGKSELTEERFRHKCGQRFYRSGDVVRMLSDGNFEFLGRTDDQVKIRGLRVELGEINKTLQDSDENIVTASTQILKKAYGQKDQLVTFLVLHHSVDENEQSRLRRAAEQKAMDTLPSYMVPQFFLFINKIPKSMAGKVDKKALASIFCESTEFDTGTDDTDQDTINYQWNERENQIREIFSKLSTTPQEDIKPWNTIFQLGLDSISAVQIAAALRKRGMQASAADVMKYMSCKDLAARLGNSPETLKEAADEFDFDAFEKRHWQEVVSTYGISEEQVEAIRPCTPLQNGMLSQFIAKEGVLYFNYLRLRLEDDIELDRLKSAWLATVRKHRMLRTGFSHIKDDSTSFAMIHYQPDDKCLPWQATSQRSGTIEAWQHDSEQDVVKHIHQPPWRLRICEEVNATYLDFALLHAIFDAQSLRLIFDDIVAAYNGSQVTAAPLEPVIENILYSSSSENTASKEFWSQLGKVAAPTRFPNLCSLRYDSAPSVMIAKSASRTLEELDVGCRAANISLQAAGLASWASLLSAYVGESTVTFGVVLSGRNIDGADKAVFPCITTVPFSCKVTDQLEEVLKDVMSLNAEMQQHQFTPLNDIQKLMGHPNEPPFDSIFAFQKLANGDESGHLWTVVDERASTEYPLSIELEPKDGQLEFRLTFLPHVIPKEQASLILNQLDYVLQRYIFSENDNKTFSSKLYSITPAKTPTIPSEAGLLHEFVELTAAKHPARIAFEFATSLQHDPFSSRQWTYAQLDGEGNRIANLLISQGARPGELVAVCFEKCPEASFAILGILKAGCAFVALDPGAPSARKVFILKDSGAAIVLSISTQSNSFKENTSAKILNLDEINWHSASSKKPILRQTIDPQDRSYCLYTSGTTGTPKGCELTHENAVQAMQAFRRLFSGHWDDESRWLQFASFHFDVSVLEQYWSWSVGICVVSAPRDLIFEDLAASTRTLRITHIDLTPSLARILHPDDVPTLCKGVFITGGESLKQEILDVWGPKSVIYNGYGPTEATIGVTMYPRVPANGKPSNIGPQFDNVGSYVLRPGSDVPVLRGGVGELCVSGKLVGKGYLNRPDLTEERFPHLSGFGERVYRTGDLVRILHDGTFDFLGRADDQVKLRGQRLEIGEINSVVKQCGLAIADVATLILKHPKQQKEQLVSFVVIGSVARGETKIMLDKIGDLWEAKEACQEKLPPYMVPTHFVALTAMPLSANNKAEARKLKDMYEALSSSELQQLSAASRVGDEKWTQQEERVRDVLKEALSITDGTFSKDTSFFELGMDSISVIGVSRALKQAGLLKAAASVILKNATVRRLLKALSDASSMTNDRCSIIAAQQAIIAAQHRYRRNVAEALFMDTRNIEALAPCTPLQQGMIARSLDSESGLYFNSFRFELRKNVHVEKLRDAWIHVFESTQILRTVFVNTEDGFVQAVLRRAELKFDKTTLPQVETFEDFLQQKKAWVESNKTHIKRPVEVLLVKTTQGKLLVVHIFHGLYDGNSIGLIFKAVWDAYNDRELESGPPFHAALAYGPLRPINDARQFWEQHLADRHFKPLPHISNSSSGEPVIVSREIRTLPSFDATRRKLNVTAQAIAQACWANILHQYIKTTATLGMVVSGRSIDLEGADKVIGPLFNTIPYQHRAQQRETWAAMIKRTHEFNVAAHPYQHTPLRNIMKWMKRGPDMPLFDTLFVYQVAEGEEWSRNELWELRDSEAEADYPLAIEVEQSSDGAIKLMLVAQGNVMDSEMATRLLEQYEEVLQQAVENPDIMPEISAEDEGSVDDTSTRNPANIDKSTETTENFQWTSHATVIRKEIASLSRVEIQNVSANTSIFELGLDSIDVIKLSSKLKTHGITLPVSKIMLSLNISNMIQHIALGGGKRDERPSDMIYKATKKRLESYLQRHHLTEGVEQVLPLTPLQEAMVAEMIASGYTRYYNHDVLELKPSTDIERLRGAWTQLVKESPILRTSFISVDDPSINFSHAQVIHYKPHDFLSITNLDSEPDFPAIFDSIREEAVGKQTPDPLFHVRLIRSPQRDDLILSVAHALYDGWSLSLLHSDIHQAYAGKFQPRPSYEPALHEILTTSGPDAAAFWRDYLSGAQSARFPRRTNPSPPHVYRKERGSRLSLDTVKSFAKQNSITLQTLGQTVHGLVLASYTKSLDVTFGSVLSGRDDESKSKLLFPTMNTVTTRAILHGSRCDMLQYVQDNFSNIKQWQHFPLRKALSLAGVQGTLMESLFIYQKNVGDETSESERLYKSVQSRSDVEYPVCVEMEVVEKELVWRCATKEEIFNEAGAQDLLDRLDTVLEAIVDQPDAPVIDFTARGTSICGLPAFTNERDTSEHDHNAAKQDGREYSVSSTANIIREVLAFVSQTPEEEITAGMTIFHIGLDSISAIKVSSLLRKRGVVLSVGEMLRAGTVDEMARIVDERALEADHETDDINTILEETLSGINRAQLLENSGIRSKDVEQVLPTTAGQIYMLSTWINSHGAMFYPEFTYRISGAVSFEILREAWKRVVDRNAILRTQFCATGDNRTPYVQVAVHNAKTSVTDVTEKGDDFKAKIASKQPYVHLFVSKVESADSWDVQLKIHHALYDGVSLRLIIQQLQDSCNDTNNPVSEDTFSKLIATTSTPFALQQRKRFWTNYLKDLPQNHLHQPDFTPISRTGIFKPALLPSVSTLESQAHKHGLTIQALLLATFAKLYAILTCTPTPRDVVIGLYLANRALPIANIHEAAIPTVNLVPLRVSTPLETDVLDIASQIMYDIHEISARANASASLWDIGEWTGVKVDTFVNFLKLPGAEDDVNKGADAVTMAQVSAWNEASSELVEVRKGLVVPPVEMADAHVNAAYLHALDIEATIRNGALDVGIFAPAEMVSLEKGEKLMEDIRSEMEGLGGL